MPSSRLLRGVLARPPAGPPPPCRLPRVATRTGRTRRGTVSLSRPRAARRPSFFLLPRRDRCCHLAPGVGCPMALQLVQPRKQTLRSLRVVQTLSTTFSHNGDPCVTPHTIPQAVLFPDLFDKPLVATFNQEHASSDGGAVLLKAAERVYGLVKAFARCGRQTRTGEDSPDRPAGLRHRVRSSRWQRCRPLGRRPHPQAARAGPGVRRALGVANDLAIRERRGRTVLYRMGRELAACVIERHRRRLQSSIWTRPTT